MPVKNALKILASHVVNFTDREGTAQERTFRTSINGAMKLHPGGSAFLGMVTLVLSIGTPCGEIVQVLTKLVARIRVDGECVLEASARGDSWFADDGSERPGAMIFDLVGDESRIALAALATKQVPAFAKRVKSARAALAKRAA